MENGNTMIPPVAIHNTGQTRRAMGGQQCCNFNYTNYYSRSFTVIETVRHSPVAMRGERIIIDDSGDSPTLAGWQEIFSRYLVRPRAVNMPERGTNQKNIHSSLSLIHICGE